MTKPPPPERYGSRKGGLYFYTLMITSFYINVNDIYNFFNNFELNLKKKIILNFILKQC